MPKNKGRNAFYFFMRDWKIRAERRGAVFKNGLRDVQQDPDCSAEWKSLSKQQKGEYEAMAKDDKIKSQVSEVKKTNFGENIQYIKAKEKEKEEFKKRMNRDIESLVNKGLREGNLGSKTFILIHTNSFFKEVHLDKVYYFPAEYAVSVFSLERGIQDTQNLIVSHTITLGYKRDAMEAYKEIHGIPVEYEGGCKNFADMYVKLVSFLSPYVNEHNKYPPLYTTNENLAPVRSLLEQLCAAVNLDTEQFVVYELETLFAHMGKELYKNKENRDPALALVYSRHIFQRYTYISNIGSECAFHKYSSNPTACSSFQLQRWAWTLCEEFCDTLGIDVIEGVHRPKGNKCDNFPSISSLNITNDTAAAALPESEPEFAATLSITNVSEQHRIKVSSRSYQDKLRRRKQSAPVEIVQHTASDDENSTFDEACSNFDGMNLEDESVEDYPSLDSRSARKKWLPTYLNEKPMKPPNVDSCASLTMNTDVATNNSIFPTIGGRGKSLLRRPITEELRKAMGRGRGSVN